VHPTHEGSIAPLSSLFEIPLDHPSSRALRLLTHILTHTSGNKITSPQATAAFTSWLKEIFGLLIPRPLRASALVFPGRCEPVIESQVFSGPNPGPSSIAIRHPTSRVSNHQLFPSSSNDGQMIRRDFGRDVSSSVQSIDCGMAP